MRSKAMLLLVGIVVLCTGQLVRADDMVPGTNVALPEAEEPAVEPTALQAPAGFWDDLKGIINTLDIQNDGLWNLESNEFLPGFSGAVYNFQTNQIHIASFRAGYALDNVVYGSLKLDLIGLGDRFLPDKVKEILIGGTPEPIKGILRKHAAVGGFGGYDTQDEVPVYGVLVGGRLKF